MEKKQTTECRDADEEYVLACWQMIRHRKKGMMDRTAGSDGSMVINPDGGEEGVAAEAVWRERPDRGLGGVVRPRLR